MSLTIYFKGGSLDGQSVSTDDPTYQQPPFDKLPDFKNLAGSKLHTQFDISGERYSVDKLNIQNLIGGDPTGEILLAHR